MKLIYLSHVSAMSLVVLQLFPNLNPHRAGCKSPLLIKKTNKSNKIIIQGVNFDNLIEKPQLEIQDYHSQSEKKIERPDFISARVITGYLTEEEAFYTRTSLVLEQICIEKIAIIHPCDINVSLIILPDSWLRSISVTIIILQIINTLQTKFIIASVNNRNFIAGSYYGQSKHQDPI